MRDGEVYPDPRLDGLAAGDPSCETCSAFVRHGLLQSSLRPSIETTLHGRYGTLDVPGQPYIGDQHVGDVACTKQEPPRRCSGGSRVACIAHCFQDEFTD